MLLEFPADIRYYILTFVDVTSLGQLALCDRAMAKLVNQEKLWQFKCQFKFPLYVHRKPASLSYRHYYYRLLNTEVYRFDTNNGDIYIPIRRYFTRHDKGYMLAIDNSVWIYNKNKNLEQLPCYWEDLASD